jgi:ATP dependent DNA ligase domain
VQGTKGNTYAATAFCRPVLCGCPMAGRLGLGSGDGRIVYFAFDLLHLDGKDLTGLPLVDRKAALEELLFGVDRVGPIRFSDHYVGRGAEFFEQACSLMLEGIVSKRAGSPKRRVASFPTLSANRSYWRAISSISLRRSGEPIFFASSRKRLASSR